VPDPGGMVTVPSRPYVVIRPRCAAAAGVLTGRTLEVQRHDQLVGVIHASCRRMYLNPHVDLELADEASPGA
jgi:hypothetical protein